MNLKAVTAIFKRNLGAYFGSASGYLFICAFVLILFTGIVYDSLVKD